MPELKAAAQTALFTGFHEDDDAPTPAMAQYIEIKNANPDCLIFYRMGDFYELFFDDAVTASRALGITLTKRGKFKGEDIPLAGVPVSAADDYLQKLIALGHRVAVCEQLEDPAEAKKRGAKAVVRRDVVRLVTPGTITEEKLLDAHEASFLLSICRTGSDVEANYGLAWLDLSTGDFHVSESALGTLQSDIARIGPKEILLPDTLYDDKQVRAALEGKAALTPLPSAITDSSMAERKLIEFFNVLAIEASAAFRVPRLPLPASFCLMSTARSAGKSRCCRSPRASCARPIWRSTRQHGSISSLIARCQARKRARCCPYLMKPAPLPAAGF